VLRVRRLAGRPTVLRFFTARSERSVASLAELAALHDSGTTVVAIGDGASVEEIGRLVGEREYPFLVVADEDRLVSRAFGVWCWPTTVWIRPDQRVEAVDLGAVAPPPEDGTAGDDPGAVPILGR
jgi:hypothetical protein